VNWIGVATLKEAIEKVRQAGKTQKPGSWIVVAGGWTEEQFQEKRRPNAAEMVGGDAVYASEPFAKLAPTSGVRRN
jgi:predicted amidohydrolase YtcJ